MKTLREILEKISGNVIARNLILAVCAVIIFISLLSLLLNLFTRHNQYKIVPDFAGRHLSDVNAQAEREHLRIEVTDSLYVPIYDGGIVLDQQPAAGTEVKSGRRIFVTVNSYRQKIVTVPYVTGFSLRQAKNVLEVAGLEIAELRYVNDIATNNVLQEYFEGRLIEKNSNLQVEAGSGITLVVGKDSLTASAEIPKVIGLKLNEAKSRLWERGLNVGKISFDEGINLLNQKDSRVYEQSPEQGQSRGLGSSVSLRLTLDEKKVAECSERSDRAAKRRQLEKQQAAEEAL